ncbi:MAG: BREX-3 system P-loop-containing protein BrxF [Anaerolineales bacterium]|nr:BREX-3 system P-loop-containing protein BrxF [Anaerolineales bacterium]
MAENKNTMALVSELVRSIELIASDRHKLVILPGDFCAGKTAVLKKAAAVIDGTYLNLNLLLTERLLKLPRQMYADGVTVHRLIDELCDELSPDGRPLLVDNVEILFSPELGRVNPVDTFKRIARQRPVVLALPARRQGDHVEYSTFGSQDYMRIPLENYTIIEMER